MSAYGDIHACECVCVMPAICYAFTIKKTTINDSDLV